MNQVLFVIIVLVILYMFKDKWLKYMPDIVKKNVLVSGLVFGFALCFFMGNNIEGFGPDCDPADEARANKEGQSCGSECDCVGTLICTDGICSQPSGDSDNQIISDCCPGGDMDAGNWNNCLGHAKMHANLSEFVSEMRRLCNNE